MLYTHEESEFYRARLKAARRVCQGWVRPEDLPTNQEIRAEIASFARLREGATSAFDGEHDLPLAPARPLDRFSVYRMLLAPLETVRQDPRRHPEGDALYHSLQVFSLAREALPYDEEFQLAALLHDVGKAIDPRDHVAAALDALDGTITPRTAWLIERHPQAQALRDGTLGIRARRRLEASEDFEDLLLLADCDRAGRRVGANVPDLDDALAHVRQLADDDVSY